MDEKSKQEISVVGRLFSLEGLIIVMGIISLVYGIIEGASMSIFWGIVILLGVAALIAVRKKDWKKHWEELEAQAKNRDKHDK